MGNGAKAEQKRQRKQKNDKDVGKDKSQRVSNLQKMDIKCIKCMQTFFTTVRRPALEQHAKEKHSETVEACFPNYTGS